MSFMKMLGNLGNLSKMQQEMQAITGELALLEYQGSAGGGMVVVKASGAQQLVSCSIDPQLIKDNDKELLEDLVVAAANQALGDAKKNTADLLQKRLSERFNLPDISNLLGGMMPT